MSFQRMQANVGAGVQFDGTSGKGLFEFPNSRQGVLLKRLSLGTGNEGGIDYKFLIRPRGGIDISIQSGTLSAGQTSVLIFGDVVVAPDEQVIITTTGATNPMETIILWENI